MTVRLGGPLPYDGDPEADFTLTVNGNLQPEQLQIFTFNESTGA